MTPDAEIPHPGSRYLKRKRGEKNLIYQISGYKNSKDGISGCPAAHEIAENLEVYPAVHGLDRRRSAGRNHAAFNITALIAHELIDLSMAIHYHFISAARALHNYSSHI